MIILGLLAFAFLIYFGAFVQWVSDCSPETALNISVLSTSVGICVVGLMWIY